MLKLIEIFPSVERLVINIPSNMSYLWIFSFKRNYFSEVRKKNDDFRCFEKYTFIISKTSKTYGRSLSICFYSNNFCKIHCATYFFQRDIYLTRVGLSIGGKIWPFTSFTNIPGYVSFIQFYIHQC